MVVTDERRLESATKGHAAKGRWVSRSRNQNLLIQAMGDTLTVRQEPPREGTVVRDTSGGVQREWAVPGWHDDWLQAVTPLEEYHWLGDIPAAGVSLKDKLDRVREVKEFLTGRDPRIAQVIVIYMERIEERHITSDAFDRRSEVGRLQFGAVVVATDGTRTVEQFEADGRVGGFEIAHIADERLDRMTEKAVRLLDAQAVEPGEHLIVAAPSVTGVLAHEAFGHGVEMDLFLSERALAAKKMGERVGSPFATIVDDPRRKDGFGGYPFDDDGNLAEMHVILDHGVLVGGLADADVQAAIGASPGNGRRQDYSRKVYPRMSNTFFEPGNATPEELIAGVERGVYLPQFESGMEDPKSWGLQLTVHHGEEIQDGRLTGRLYRTMAMTGYVPDVLQSIDGASSELNFSPGMCGKGWKEWATNGTGGPHLRFRARLG